ncbi:MAG: multiheme c-type cytochrome [Burkholderiaceae bacterium]
MKHNLRVLVLPLLAMVLALSALLGGVGAVSADSKTPEATAAAATATAAADPHVAIVSQDSFPSASKCKACHTQIYDEWRSSSHAYAGISPMFHKFEQKITELAPTIGTFCVRCHMGAGTALGEDRADPMWKRSQIAREGVTCVSCHRVSQEYSKANGERFIEPSGIHGQVYGPFDGKGVEEAVNNPAKYKVASTPEGRGTKIHASAFKMEQISKSEFCVSCHQVNVNLGIKLEVVWDQYRSSPAKQQGVSCQDCHMGKVPGKAEGYATGAVAKMGKEVVNSNRKHANHAFYGPGYPIAHPGVFPHNENAEKWSMEDWLKFDYRAKWGSEEFESQISSGKLKVNFPPEWSDALDRASAWEVVQENLEGIEKKKQLRTKVMENGAKVDGPFFNSALKAGESLSFSYKITNTNSGHNLPSGSLGAQPELWLNVALIAPDGKRVWESGNVDSNGDFADQHSLDVIAGKLPFDDQLWSLQTKFLTTNVKGTEREMYLPVNFDVDQLPFLRPAGQPVTVLNHPPFVRMEQRSIPPLGTREAKFKVPSKYLTMPGKYKLAVRMRSRAEPIYFMRFVGATTDMERSMNEWMLNIHASTAEFQVKK